MTQTAITGATGFIGLALAQELCQGNHGVRALLRSEPLRPLPDGIETVRGDLAVPASLRKAFEGCDQVYHLAAMVSFDPARRAELMAVNAQGTRNVLDAAREAGVERVLVVSSAITMGVSDQPVERDENHEAPAHQRRANPYCDSKLAAESICAEAVRAGQDVVIVNPTTVYGPGDWSLNSGSLIRQVATGRFVPVPTGGGNVVDVRDVVAGMLASMEKGKSGARYCLGGWNLSFDEIFRNTARATGRCPRFIPLPRVARLPMMLAAWGLQRATGSRLITPQIIGDLFRYKYFSSAKAERELGWKASRPFLTSVSEAWEFYRREGLIA